MASRPVAFDYFTERYYNQYVVKDCKGVKDNNCRLLVHSNGLVVLCIDDSHAAIQRHRANTTTKNGATYMGARLATVMFGSGRGDSKMTPGGVCVVGKRKKNALVCYEDTNICVITMTDGTLYKIPACVDGFILELNPLVQERPEIVVEAPTIEGFIAVISPKLHKLSLDRHIKVSDATGGDAVEETEEFLKDGVEL